MTPQQLKNSILQLAIQGKLVEQIPSDGTAEELYTQVQNEKRRLIAENKIKKSKPSPAITEDEIPFDIPESWKWVHFCDIAESSLGKTLNAKTDVGEDTPYLCSINVYWDGINLDNVKTAKFTVDQRNKYMLKKGDLLVCEGGDAGRSCVWNSNSPMWYQNALHCIRFYGGINSVFYKYVMELYKANGLIDASCRGVTIKHFVQGSLYSLPIPLPSLNEQNRIVDRIQQLFKLVDRYGEAWSKLEAFNQKFPEDMKKSILQQAMHGKLVERVTKDGTGHQCFNLIQLEKQAAIASKCIRKTKQLPCIEESFIRDNFPEHWKVCYLDDVAFVTKLAGFEYSSVIAPNLKLKGIPLFKGKNISNGRLVLDFESFIDEETSNSLPRSQIRKKCLLTPYVGTIGNIAIFDGSFKAHLGSNVGKIEILNPNAPQLLEEFLLYYLRSPIGYKELIKFKKATAQESISIEAIRNVVIPIPPVEEQKRIVKRIEELFTLCDSLIK